MLPAAGAVLLQFHPAGIIASVLFGDVITFFALGARKCDVGAHSFFGHNSTLLLIG
jgi:hypothetical protein